MQSMGRIAPVEHLAELIVVHQLDARGAFREGTHR
jgi:hypothetical protein